MEEGEREDEEEKKKKDKKDSYCQVSVEQLKAMP